jgi:chaperonin GroES
VSKFSTHRNTVDFYASTAVYFRHKFINVYTHNYSISKHMKKTKKKNTSPARTARPTAKSVKPAKSALGHAYTSGKTHILPLGDRILIRPVLAAQLEAKNDFGIIIPDTVSKERPEQGVVVAVGEGRTENGVVVPMKVMVGDTVIFSKYGFDEVKVDNSELYILKEDSVLAIVRS